MRLHHFSFGAMERKVLLRLLLLAALSFILMMIAKWIFGDTFTYQNLEGMLSDNGIWGVAIFLGACMISALMHIPAFVLLSICFLVYNGWTGALIGITAVFVIFTTHFLIARLVGGNVLENIKHPYLIKKLSSLDHQPLKSIVLLRLVFFMAPLLNFALGLSSIRYSDFIIGSLIGISIHFIAIFLLVNFSREMVMNWLI